MARYRGQKALYEVMRKASSRPAVEPLRPPEEPRDDGDGGHEPISERVEARWLRPRALQFNAGRVELTLTYRTAAICGLAIIALWLLTFRLGQMMSQPPIAPVDTNPDTGVGSVDPVQPDSTDVQAQVTRTVSTPVAPGRGNVIRFLSYSERAQLEPVRRYFAQHGIASEIKQVSSGFVLETVERFTENPLKPGTTGSDRLRQIVALGAGYQSPAGYLAFTPKSFEGAYGYLYEN